MEGAWFKAFEVAREAFPKLHPEEAAVGRGVRYSACSHRFELEFLGLPVTATSVRNRYLSPHTPESAQLKRANKVNRNELCAFPVCGDRSKCAVVLDIGPREAYHELRFIGSGRSDARSLDIIQETVIADTIRQECWC